MKLLSKLKLSVHKTNLFTAQSKLDFSFARNNGIKIHSIPNGPSVF